MPQSRQIASACQLDRAGYHPAGYQSQAALEAVCEPYRLWESIQAGLAAQRRHAALQAIVARLDAARREHAESYLASRLRRETSCDLS